MGVPAFFRWLSSKYTNIVTDAVELGRNPDGTSKVIDNTAMNPNFQEFDNLYLDMNGIIHPCTHPEDEAAPITEEDMFALICKYIDRVFSIIRPRKLLYLAIDGVAPRAKMNQQRSRRFRSVQEAAMKAAQIKEVRERLLREGVPLPPAKEDKDQFDSNCITPGTPFMARLSEALKKHIDGRIKADPAWKKIKVILSDAKVPGEGEHKVINYIRNYRESPDFDPNLAHCLYGADADLIMLALATHCTNFTIIREEFTPNFNKPCELCNQQGHDLKDCRGLAKPDESETPMPKASKHFLFVHIDRLRDNLKKELEMQRLFFPYDFERALDDWVFLCFFVGNDFLPHLPSLEIRERAIDRLVRIYKEHIHSIGGWLTDDGKVNIDRVLLILEQLGKVEDTIFRERQNREMKIREGEKQRRRKKRLSDTAVVLNRQIHTTELIVTSGASSADNRRYSLDTVTPSSHFTPSSEPSFITPIQSRGAIGLSTTASMHTAKTISSASSAASTSTAIPSIIDAQKLLDQTNDANSASATATATDADPALTPGVVFIDASAGRRVCVQRRELTEQIVISRKRHAAPTVPAGPPPKIRNPKEGSSGVQESSSTKSTPVLPSSSFSSPALTTMPSMPMPGLPLAPALSEDSDEDAPENDDVRLWEPGWKERYYWTKFGVPQSDLDFRRKLACAYVEGCSWVFAYYYKGCVSWSWFYPYHYAPFASDFILARGFKADFSAPTTPFKPFEQLMSVFPAASNKHIPEGWRHLMSDEESPIYDFYPLDFKIDLNGKRYAWQGVALLPFVDEQRLLKVLGKHATALTEEDRELNKFGEEMVLMPAVPPEERAKEAKEAKSVKTATSTAAVDSAKEDGEDKSKGAITTVATGDKGKDEGKKSIVAIAATEDKHEGEKSIVAAAEDKGDSDLEIIDAPAP